MHFEKGYIYHIYNQGNNRQKIFFYNDNYYYFLEKVKKYILPYADIFAWCLMPNHFHLMVMINEISIIIKKNGKEENLKEQTLNDSIGILLRSYTRAINIQNDYNGSLFSNGTKAECINCQNGIAPAWFQKIGITAINLPEPEKQFLQICFNYIHDNPVKSGLVKNIQDWEFSSARDYLGYGNVNIINKEKAREYLSF
jgi:putative transposase